MEEITDILIKKTDKDKALYSSSKIEKLAEKAKEKAKKEKRFVSQEDLLKIANKTNPNIDSHDIDNLGHSVHQLMQRNEFGLFYLVMLLFLCPICHTGQLGKNLEIVVL